MTVTAQKTISFLLLAFGTFILAVSLLAANQIPVGDQSRLLNRKIYLGRTILPDNILYPVVMVGDRLKLETSSHENKILQRIEYANRRFQYATELAEKKQDTLALTTLSKSQKYLFASTNEILSSPTRVSPDTIVTVRDALDTSTYKLQLFKETYTGENAGIVDDLLIESSILLHKLNTLIEQN